MQNPLFTDTFAVIGSSLVQGESGLQQLKNALNERVVPYFSQPECTFIECELHGIAGV